MRSLNENIWVDVVKAENSAPSDSPDCPCQEGAAYCSALWSELMVRLRIFVPWRIPSLLASSIIHYKICSMQVLLVL